jgi:hypothetical protein
LNEPNDLAIGRNRDIEIINTAYVWHSDRETPETISTTGLAAVTRTYAKVIADTDSIELKELRASLTRRP